MLLLGNPASHSVASGMCFAFEGDGASSRRGEAGDGVDGGSLAGAVTAEEGGAAAFGDFEGDALQDVARAVEGVYVLEFKHRVSRLRRSRSP